MKNLTVFQQSSLKPGNGLLLSILESWPDSKYKIQNPNRKIMFELIDEQKIDRIFSEIGLLRKELKTEKEKHRKKLSEVWLDNQEVMQLLKVSPRTLQSMRDTGTLPYSKVGGKIYYKTSDVEKILNENYHG